MCGGLCDIWCDAFVCPLVRHCYVVMGMRIRQISTMYIKWKNGSQLMRVWFPVASSVLAAVFHNVPNFLLISANSSLQTQENDVRSRFTPDNTFGVWDSH